MVNNIKNTDRIVVDLEMPIIDHNEQKIKSLKQEISDKYGVPLRNIDINFIPIALNEDGEKISLASNIIDNIHDPQFILELMRNYISMRGIEGINFDDIETIDKQVNALVDFDLYSKCKSYKVKYVKWSNYLSYGPDNYFDFTNLHGLVLLNGEPANQCGKTTFAIDLLRFALFGKAKKSPTLDSVFNAFLPEATEVVVEACLEIDGDDYVIRRTVTRPALKKRTAKSKYKQVLEYYKKINDSLELIENCEGESSTQTNNIIRDAIGNVEDFNLVVSATSKTLSSLVDMGATDKGKLFSRWLGLLTIEKKEEIAKKMWKETYQPKLLSNTYNGETLKNEIIDYNDSITTYLKSIDAANEELAVINDNIIKYNKEKTNVLASMRPIANNLDTINVTTLDNNLSLLNSEYTNKLGEFSTLKEEYISMGEIIYEDNEISEHEACKNRKTTLNDNINQLNILNAELRTRISMYRDEIKRVENLSQIGVCPTCGHPIDIVEQSGHISSMNEQINQLIAHGVKNKETIDTCTRMIEDEDKKILAFDALLDSKRRKAQLELKLTALKTNIENIKMRIAQIEQTKRDIETNIENIKFNGDIRAKANVIDTNIANEDKLKNEKITIIENSKNIISNYNREIDLRKDIIKKLEEEEVMIKNWNLYLELVGKNGIMKIVLRQALPIINNEIARILNGLCDFDVKVDVDDKNNVIMVLTRNGISLDLGTASSGFESVMSSLALRSALASISSMSKPNFLVLDEVLDGVAVCNYENVHELYKRIVNNYDFILHITHNELLTDWHDGGNISVIKEDNVSKIKFN